jgi:phosphatidylglycerol---prolipoprotein diacylglyceryl transferase
MHPHPIDLVLWRGPAYTLFITGAALLLAAVTLWRTPPAARRATADILLLALLIALAGGRLAHVAVQWAYFADHISEIPRLTAGGLNWHGALIGALAGVALGARWRGLAAWPLLDRLAWGLPWLALATWAGCWANACGYGAEVATLADYPVWIAGWVPDVYGIEAPRLYVQGFGMALALALLATALVLARIDRTRGMRFGILLALLGLGMAALGTLRADAIAVVAGQRADLWLDLAMVVLGIALARAGRRALLRQGMSSAPVSGYHT